MDAFSDKLNTLVDEIASDGYSIVDHFLSREEIDSILELDDFKNSLLHFKKAGIGDTINKQINEGIRGDYIQWIDRATAPHPLRNYLSKLEGLISAVNQGLFLSLKDYEVHLTNYPPGSYYRRHLDQFKKDDHRKLSVICYLNKNWKVEEGGQLRIYHPDGERDVLPLAGRLVCFRSDLLEHEVLPASRPRMSLTGWMLDQYTDLKHL
ncbi:MAG: 2OG-Fe(II) oxygenase [Cyclobacteriaceae bacterium]|nr:2OG-Fe(II) oxygenase [Cyclobacteriaceae bacterium]